MDAWLKQWVLDVASHEAYRALLGTTRIQRLRRRAREDTWREDLEEALAGVDLEAAPTPEERAVVAASRVLQARVRDRGYRTLLAGAGMSNLAAWLAAYELAEGGTPIDLAAEMGLVGYWPHAGEPMLFNQRNFPAFAYWAARSLWSDPAQVLYMAALPWRRWARRRTRDQGATGANGAVLWRYTPSTYDSYAETVVAAVQTRDRFVEEVPYVTATGDRIGVVVTQCGVYEKDDGELVLTAVYDEDVEAGARQARERCGWELRTARSVRRVDPPSRDELLSLRLMDPHGWFRS